MNLEEILERFALFGGIEREEAAAYGMLCEDAACDLRKRLRRQSDEAANARRLCAAAAALAYFRYVLWGAAGRDGGSFRAGDVSISAADERVKGAAALWREERAGVADLLQDDGFCFWGVRV
jgi:hypothetical protein